MTESMTERVARAMMRDLERQGEPYSAGPLYDSPEADTELLQYVVIDGAVDMLALARAAIAAMREPTEAMVAAGWADSLAEDAAATWRTMIDEALKEPPPGA